MDLNGHFRFLAENLMNFFSFSDYSALIGGNKHKQYRNNYLFCVVFRWFHVAVFHACDFARGIVHSRTTYVSFDRLAYLSNDR